MPTVTVVLDGGSQLSVQTLDQTPLNEVTKALNDNDIKFRIAYQDAVIIVPDRAKVFGVAVSGI